MVNREKLDTVFKFIISKQETPLNISFFLFTIDMYRYNNFLTRQEIDEPTFTKIKDAIDKILSDFLKDEAKKHQQSL